MSAGEWLSLIFGGLLAGVVAWIVNAHHKPLTGTWLREDWSDTDDDEHITIDQLGPFVIGKRELPIGYQRFFGVRAWSAVRLQRRDYGVEHLVRIGFPRRIAERLDGSVMAKLELRYDGRAALRGWFFPQKISFDEASGRVLTRQFQSPTNRRYTRVVLDPPAPPPVETPPIKKTRTTV